MGIPYYKICIYAFFLVVPLSIGLLIHRYCPKVSNFLIKILKPMALFLILFIIIFGFWAAWAYHGLDFYLASLWPRFVEDPLRMSLPLPSKLEFKTPECPFSSFGLLSINLLEI